MQACRVFRNSVAAVRVPSRSTSTANVLSLLQKTVSILPRSLSDDPVGPASSVFWCSVLERSITELSGQVPSTASVAISGLDKWARSHDLVTALLQDPFTSDAAYPDILRNRWKGAPSHINIEYGKPAAFAGEFSSPSEWLQRFPYPIQLTELPDLVSLSNVSDETYSLLLNSDVLLLLCDPVVTPLSDLSSRAKHLLDKPNAILVLTSGSPSDHHHQFVSQTLTKMGCQPRCILFVDPGQALDAVTALQADPTSPSTIERYQRDTLSSRISAVTAAIHDILSSKHVSETSLLDLRRGTALSQVYASLSASFRSVEATSKCMDHVSGKIEELSSRIRNVREDADQEIFGMSKEGDKVGTALSSSAKEMKTLLGSLTFWKMVWRVDEVGAFVSTAIQGQWCKGLERQLVLQTGCLEFIQREMSTVAFSLVSVSSLSSLRSPVLENKLEQLKHSPSRVLATDSLTRPIYTRRSQLIQHTTTRLHREAQSAVVGVFGSLLSGAGLGWWLVFGEHILDLGAGSELGTAIGSGVLLAVSGVRWAVGKWEWAKQRWIRDLARVGEGLERDLRTTVQQTMDEKVTIVASTACEGVQDLVDRQRKEISKLQEELGNLDSELRAYVHFPAKR